MPKKVINDYIFYKIVCISDDIDLCYVGSTANWKERQRKHKNTCYNENTKEYNSKKYQIIRENGGWCNFKMVQLGTREQLTKREAEQIEEEYRQELKANMNGKRCYIAEEQKQEQDKAYDKKYRDANRYKLNEKAQKYREANRDKINKKQNEKVKCECGCMSSKINLLRHKKTPKHIKLMEMKTNENNIESKD